jgi:hypothetical protein
MNHPEEQPSGSDDSEDAPKFGRLLLILAAAVLIIVGITLASEAFYS